MQENQDWDIKIRPKQGLFSINFDEIYRYRDLLMMLVKKDFVTYYKQTIMGHLWFLFQPVFTAAMYFYIFSHMAKIPTSGINGFVFYLAGIALWNYFAECLNRSATTFKDNEGVFGKVYFPRIIVPLSISISNLVKLGIQLSLFGAVYVYFYVTENNFAPTYFIFTLPLLIIQLALLGTGLGLIITSLTTKYRDLVFLIQFGVQILMFATPVIYPLENMKGSEHILLLNPLTAIFESFKYGCFGRGYFNLEQLGISALVTIIIFLMGIFIFNKTEKSFMDTI